MIGNHDRQESDEQVDRATSAIQAARVQFSELVDQLPPPLSGSMLDTERNHTRREPLDSLVMAHRARATENLARMFETMIDESSGQFRAYPFSPYSHIRTAIEAAAMSMWLIKSSRKSDRVFRALQLAYRNSQEAVQFSEVMFGKDAAAPAIRMAAKSTERLNQLKDSVGPLKQRELSPPPPYTVILKAVSPKSGGQNRRPGYPVSSPIAVWKLSSAFLHGSEQVMRALSDVRQMDEFAEGVASFEITPNVQVLAVSIRACVDLIAQLDERYTYLATHDYARRPV